MEKKVVLVLFALLLGGTAQGQRILDRCTLAIEMDRLGVPRQDLAAWVFIADILSSYQTHAISPKNADGSRNYGLFQFSSKYWCKSTDTYSSNHCKISCDSLLTDNIKASVDCAVLVKKMEGWTPWQAAYDKFASVEAKMTSVEDCFEVRMTNDTVRATSRMTLTEQRECLNFVDYKPEFEF
ncbi:lysozyme P-like [Drosophila sulfurigaster albostrigata]|uniref:lysozyme P-like n=1 Tax=Drosophila sulfurigaster albostrigata TaxID=89887 RepID=UPI002D21AA76|nr:lysozyme P-like [Drosophila sulfurigaster albostrigata]